MSVGLAFHIVSTQDDSYSHEQNNTSSLPTLGTPYVGAAHETSRVVGLLPLPGENFTVVGIEIGKDHGQTGYGDYTLTVLYSYHDVMRRFTEAYEAAFRANADFLFEHIGNLQAVTFMVDEYQWSQVR